MPKTYHITAEQACEARDYMKNVRNTTVYKRLEVIALRGEGRKNLEIAQITGYNRGSIAHLVSRFIHEGFDGILIDRRGGFYRKVPEAEVQSFLDSYESEAGKGQILTVMALHQAFQDYFQIEMTLQAFYHLLHRHKWRKIRPRAQHPKKADAETIQASKKLSQNI